MEPQARSAFEFVFRSVSLWLLVLSCLGGFNLSRILYILNPNWADPHGLLPVFWDGWFNIHFAIGWLPRSAQTAASAAACLHGAESDANQVAALAEAAQQAAGMPRKIWRMGPGSGFPGVP